MKIKKILIAFGVSAFAALNANAQDSSMNAYSHQKTKMQSEVQPPHGLNIVKLHLTAIAFKNYSLQYERVLSKPISVAVSFKMMPSTGIPFKSLVLKSMGDDDNSDTKNIIESFRMSSFSITPEMRWYVGKKGYGRGFYIAPFYRYSHFNADNISVTYSDGSGNSGTINLSGKLNANTGGILFGAQWFFGKHIVFDWSILGPHYGSGDGDFIGISDQVLPPQAQEDIKKQLDDIDIPLTKKTVTVDANQVEMMLKGPWLGIRAGLSIGFRF